MAVIQGRAETERDGTRKRTGGEVKGKKVKGGGSQYPLKYSVLQCAATPYNTLQGRPF